MRDYQSRYMTRMRWKWLLLGKYTEINTLSSTRVNIEKNNFLRDYFNSISFFFCITVGYSYNINILHEVSLFIYIIGGGGLRGGGKRRKNSHEARAVITKSLVFSFFLFFLRSLKRVAITMIMLKVVLKVVKDIFFF